jgi:hypothetical protein
VRRAHETFGPARCQSGFPEIAGQRRKVDQRHDAVRSLRVFRQPEVVNRHYGGAGRVQPGREADDMRNHRDFEKAGVKVLNPFAA